MSVRQVDEDRWHRAQEWERRVWEREERPRGLWRLAVLRTRLLARLRGHYDAAGDDWNGWWAAQFDQYACLPTDLGRYVELGCGPYTNTRLILRGRTAARVVCSDPLIQTYLTFRRRWLAEAHRRGVVEVDDHPLEDCTLPRHAWDTVVLINVLDHVRDADRCLTTALDLLAPGGYFLLGQDLTNAQDRATVPFDLGHPIRLERESLEPYLARLMPVLRKDLPRAAGRNPAAHYATLIYAGRAPS